MFDMEQNKRMEIKHFFLQKRNFDPTKHTRYTVFTAQSVVHRITILNNTSVNNIIIKVKIILIL